LWKDADAAVEANEQLLKEARNEPSIGPASLEGLSMVHQFGRELQDALTALSLAVKGSDGDRYAARLEPELGYLTADIHRGFQYVAGCIHRWKFDEPLQGLDLEDDIAALKAKMAEIQPASLEFPQSEILRAYAVQLHLKQLARLLRSARIETSGTIG
jgi:hypothetical protein